MIDPLKPDYTNTPASPKRRSFGYAPADPTVSPHVTIVTPFYNGGAIFHETARSVLQQSFQQWEWLIVNDGSTDAASLAILESYRQADPRIRVIDHVQNIGPSAARNTGAAAARTEFIVPLDSDDLMEPTALEKWRWYLECYPEYSFVKGYTVGFGALEYLATNGFHTGPLFLEQNRVNATCMIRKAVLQAVGGQDEANREGLEDWDFWLHCASLGYWGGTVPEFLDWYRRSTSHGARWPNWDNGKRQRSFHKGLRQKYPALWQKGFPQIDLRRNILNVAVPDELPCNNRLRKDKPHLLMILPWLNMGGADKFNLDLLQMLTDRGWTVSIATTLKSDHPWLAQFARFTPDIFCLERFLRLIDYPRFLTYLIHSRQSDVVMISHSWLGYLLLPYLRAHCPAVTFVDYCHIEEEHWGNGGYPQLAIEYKELLDLSIVSSQHLREWMIGRGGDDRRVEVCYTNIDAREWQALPEQRCAVRRELQIDEKLPMILFAGRVCAQKQPRVFAKTMLLLRQQGVRFVAVVAGTGPEIGWLRSFLTKHQLQKQVRLMGAVSNERIKELMSATDVYFLPSRWEGIAVSIYEAMASGVPVVGADVGGQRELVSKECGILVAPGDEETETGQYATALAELLRNPERRRQMGEAGRKRVETQFRSEQMAEGMLDVFGEAKRLHSALPRPVPSVSVGRTCATQAIEYTWLSETRQRLLDPHGAPWLRLAYYTIMRSPLRPMGQTLARVTLRLLLPSARSIWRHLPLSQTMRERIHPYKR